MSDDVNAPSARTFSPCGSGSSSSNWAAGESVEAGSAGGRCGGFVAATGGDDGAALGSGAAVALAGVTFAGAAAVGAAARPSGRGRFFRLGGCSVPGAAGGRFFSRRGRSPSAAGAVGRGVAPVDTLAGAAPTGASGRFFFLMGWPSGPKRMRRFLRRTGHAGDWPSAEAAGRAGGMGPPSGRGRGRRSLPAVGEPLPEGAGWAPKCAAASCDCASRSVRWLIRALIDSDSQK